MDNELKVLLDAELEAEALVKKALDKREELTAKALQEARLAESRFEQNIPELRRSFMKKAEKKAQQKQLEIEAHYRAKQNEWRHRAENAQESALKAAADLILDPNIL